MTNNKVYKELLEQYKSLSEEEVKALLVYKSGLAYNINLLARLDDIEDKIDVIKSMNELSDADQDKILKLIDEKQGIRKEIKKLRKEVKEIDNNQTQTIKDLEEQIPINTAELLETIKKIFVYYR